MKRLVCLAGAITLVGAPSALAHETEYLSSIEIEQFCFLPCSVFKDAKRAVLEAFVGGTVESEKGKCIAGRKVKVFALSNGTRELVDVTTTGQNGGWGARGDFSGASGVAVKLPKKNIGSNGHKHICGPDGDDTVIA